VVVLLGVVSLAGEWGVPQLLGPNINTAAKEYYPYITTDGKTLYFVSDFGLNDDIYVSYWDSLTSNWGLRTKLNSNINTVERELSPSLTPDGKRLYFVRYGWPGGYGSYDIWYSDWDTTINDWGVPQNAGLNINTDCIEWSASISRDGKKLFFSSGYREGIGSCDFQGIYVTQWDSINGVWSKPVWVGNIVNPPGTDNGEPSAGSDDTTLYFESGWPHNDTNYQGGEDIFKAYFNGSSWYKVENPGAPLNSTAWDISPCISADGQRLYFASRRDDTTYGFNENLFVAERVTGIKEEKGGVIKPSYFNLTAYPNPFNSSITVTYSIKSAGNVSLVVYNLLGQKVSTLDSNFRKPGVYSVGWDGRNSSGQKIGSGVYFLMVSSGDYKESGKIVLLK